MSDVALVALFSGSATVLVAVCGLLGTIFGPARAERVRAEKALAQEHAAREERRREERFARAEALSTALIDAVGQSNWSGYAKEDDARMKFISVLAEGEGEVARFVTAIGKDLGGTTNHYARKRIVLADMELLFAWLRGDIAMDELHRSEDDQAANT